MISKHKARLIAGISFLVVCSVLAIWFFRQPPQTLYEQHKLAAFAQPSKLAQQAASEFSILAKEVAWHREPLTAECGEPIKLQVILPPARRGLDSRHLIIVARTKESGEEGFQFFDVSCDRLINLEAVKNDPEDRHPRCDPYLVNLAPGVYSVRVYLKTFEIRHDSPPPPVTKLLAKTEMTVLPNEEGLECGKVPLSDPKGVVRAHVSD